MTVKTFSKEVNEFLAATKVETGLLDLLFGTRRFDSFMSSSLLTTLDVYGVFKEMSLLDFFNIKRECGDEVVRMGDTITDVTITDSENYSFISGNMTVTVNPEWIIVDTMHGMHKGLLYKQYINKETGEVVKQETPMSSGIAVTKWEYIQTSLPGFPLTSAVEQTRVDGDETERNIIASLVETRDGYEVYRDGNKNISIKEEEYGFVVVDGDSTSTYRKDGQILTDVGLQKWAAAPSHHDLPVVTLVNSEYTDDNLIDNFTISEVSRTTGKYADKRHTSYTYERSGDTIASVVLRATEDGETKVTQYTFPV
ncbi:hypothetical protein [Vibrio phage vB_pir03]|nr:hypothetical protein [Vibrio phage vB_pir03]